MAPWRIRITPSALVVVGWPASLDNTMGDVREALGEPGAYESDGVEDALVLLVERSRRQAFRRPWSGCQIGSCGWALARTPPEWPSWSPTWRPWSGCAQAATLTQRDFGWTALIPRSTTDCSADSPE